jgi:hypothetical protein
LSRTCESELMSSDWQCEEVDVNAFWNRRRWSMLTEFDCCNSKNQSSSVADADTSETKEDCDNKSENRRKINSMIASASCLFFCCEPLC